MDGTMDCHEHHNDNEEKGEKRKEQEAEWTGITCPPRSLAEWKHQAATVWCTHYEVGKLEPVQRRKHKKRCDEFYRSLCGKREESVVEKKKVHNATSCGNTEGRRRQAKLQTTRYSKRTIQVFVKTPLATTLTLNLDRTSSVKSVKDVIQDHLGVDPSKQVLTFGRLKMCDLLTLQDHGVTNESNLSLEICPGIRGGADRPPEDAPGNQGPQAKTKLNNSEQKQMDVDNEKSEKASNQKPKGDQTGIVEKLHDSGLDGDYWAAVVKNKLGITRAAQIEHLRIDDLKKIRKDIRHGWEENALRKCFGISEEASLDESQIKEGAKQLLSDVCLLREKGVSHTDQMIQSKLEKLRSTLDVTDEQWIKPFDNKSLDDMISKLTSEMGTMDMLSDGRHTYNASELLEKASGGLALRGVLLGVTLGGDDKRTVLRTPQDVQILNPMKEHVEAEEHFSSKEKFDHFTRSLDTLGYSFTAAAKGGRLGFQAEVGINKKHETEDEKKSETHKQTIYEYRMKYAFIPTASCELKTSSLKLSQEALEALRNIDEILALSKGNEHSKVINEKCKEFLNLYGSHTNVGVLHFGGVNKFIATFTSETRSDSDSTKSMMRDALSSYVSASYNALVFNVGGSVGYDKLKNHASFSGKYSESELAKTTFKTIRNGGPKEQSSFPLWKRGLAQYNSTWDLIDRGNQVEKDFLGIWTVISNHHKGDFKKPDQLTSSLKAAWEKMTGYHGPRDKGEPLKQAVDAMDKMTKKIAEFNSRPINEKQPRMYVDNLKDILETVEQVEELTGTSQSWENELCSNACISSFLKRIVELNDQFESGTVSKVRLLMRKLVKPVKFKTFPEKRTIVNWAEGKSVEEKDEVFILANASIESIPDLIKNMKETFLVELKAEDFRNEKEDEQIRDKINRRATTDLTVCINQLLSHLHKSEKFRPMFCLNIALLSLYYRRSRRQFAIVLEMSMISDFVEKLEALWKDFLVHETKGKIQLEAYLMHNLLTSGHFDGKQSCENNFSELMKDFKLHLSPKIIEVLDRYATKSPFDWYEMTRVTAELQNGNMSVVEERKVNIDDLKEVPIANDGKVHYENQNNPSKNDSPDDAFADILEKIGLGQYYPSKISLSDALVIKKNIEYPNLTDLPWMIIHRLIMIDYRARDQIFELLKRSQDRKDDDGDIDDDDDEDDIDEFLETQSTPSGEDNTTQLHPLDVLVAIFTCCDNILKQRLAQKLFVCKLAIPFLYPLGSEGKLMMSLWALRTITVQNKGIETPVTTKPLPLVTFVRLGRPPLSKSKLMNDILMDSSHDIFFNHDCCNGTATRRLADGLVECSWFITAGKEKDHLPSTAMFLNLRGDASSMEKQMQVLQEMSSVIFVMVTAHDLAKSPHTNTCQRILQSNAKVTLLISGNDVQEKKVCIEAVGRDLIKKKGHRVMKSTNNQGRPLNASERKTSARNLLSKMISDGCDGKGIEKYVRLAEDHGIIIDEQGGSCIEGRTLAKNVLSHIEGMPPAECKTRVLPLQGTEWIEYCQLQKKQQRESKNAHEAEQMKQQMIHHRRTQVEICQTGLRSFINVFRSNLQKKPDIVVVYILNWMTIFLNDISRETLPNLRREYHKQWAKFQEFKNDQQQNIKDKIKLDELKSEMDIAEHRLAGASLGLEHLFRELGQIYEAVKGSNIAGEDTKAAVDRLPKIVANLLVNGNPMEIVDGDTSSVPIAWVSAVMKELEKAIGITKKLFVISVLGIQSSGKSTLLNTMFGLQFSVSAGRCTRGAYMQLIPVDKSRSLPFDYVVVIDTEGLRAAELTQLHRDHDNELATLVIGLGDVTMINIKGENVSEMKDFVQIAVHAFLRMNIVSRNIKNNKTCIFVHQNVPATNAHEMLKHGTQKLLEILNDMTKEAANSENIADIYSFSQIIDFDVHKHVWYFSDLWHGNPPMSPANPGYSEKVREVRFNILDEIAKKQSTFLTTSDLSSRINDLWKGVLADDFVFSFRNSLEVKAFNALQAEYYKLEWALQSHLQSWLNQEERNMRVINTTEELEQYYHTTITKLSKMLDEQEQKVRTELEDYFKNCNLRDIIIQWEQAKMIQLRVEVDKLQYESKQNLLKIKESCRLEITHSGKWSGIEERIVAKATNLAEKLRGKKMSDDELNCEFEAMWVKMVTELAPTIDDKELPMHLIVENVLRERFKAQGHSQYLSPELYEHPLYSPLQQKSLEGSFTTANVGDKDFSMKHWWKKLEGTVRDKPNEAAKQMTLTLTGNIMQVISTYLTNLKSDRDSAFQTAYATKVINTIIQRIKAFNEDEQQFFQIHAKYTAKLAVHVSRHCVRVFNEIRSDYKKKHGVNAKLENYKKTAFSLFINMVKQSTEEVIAGDTFCNQLTNIVLEEVMKSLPGKIVDRILHNSGNTKYHLIAKMLEDLADEGNFDNYQSYIHDAKSFASRWLTQYTNKYLFEIEAETSRYVTIAKDHIKDIMRCVEQGVDYATEEVEGLSDGEKMERWVEKFSASVVKKIPVPVSELRQVQNREVKSFNHLKDVIFDQLDRVEKELVKVFTDESEYTVKWNGEPPAERYLDKVWGCDAQCPFCKEPCSNTTPGHYEQGPYQCHRCVKHKPTGIRGTRWKDSQRLVHDICTYSITQKNVSFECGVCSKKCRKHSKCTTTGSNDVYHEYRDYKKYLEEWDIDPDTGDIGSKYWKWFMNKYQQQLAKLYHADLPEIPGSWNSITMEEAKADLHKFGN